jgi:magnesium chelatase family protein
MVSKTYTCTLIGVSPKLIEIETDLSLQLPGIHIVGLPGTLTYESRERIRSAFQNSNLEWPSKKITINMRPVNFPKWGAHLELSMSVGIALTLMEKNFSQFKIFACGEHSLSGEILPCGWIPQIRNWLEELSTKEKMIFLFHPDDAKALTPKTLNQAKVLEVKTLKECCLKLNELGLEDKSISAIELNESSSSLNQEPDFSLLKKIQNERLGKLAALLASTCRFHVFLAGPQGTGKSMLLQSICKALLPHSKDESEQYEAVKALFGEQISTDYGSFKRNVVFLQTSITRAALEGALLTSGQVLPGEFTRAHCGVIVADEFCEYRRDVIESLRQPMEEKVVRLQRAKFRAQMPADFQLLVSTNLCPCGLHGRWARRCRCKESARVEYQKKCSAPILDRFDILLLIGDDRAYDLYEKSLSLKAKKILDDALDESKWVRRSLRLKSLVEANLDWFCVSEKEKNWIESQFFSAHVRVKTFSLRAKEKLFRVAQAISYFVESDRLEWEHFELALSLRQDIEAAFCELNGFGVREFEIHSKIN